MTKDSNWYYLKQDEINNLIGNKFEVISQKTSGFLGCFGRSEFQRSILSIFDKLIFNHILSFKISLYFIYSIKKNKLIKTFIPFI